MTDMCVPAFEEADRPAWSMDVRGRSPDVLVEIRRWVAAALFDLGAPHLDDTILIAVELVTNAFDHGGGPHEIRLTRSRTPCLITVEVDDATTDPPVLGRSRFVGEYRGRGLILIDKLAEDWGMTVHSETAALSTAKTIWAHISCAANPCP